MKNKLLAAAIVAATIAIAASLLGGGRLSPLLPSGQNSPLSPSGQMLPLAATVLRCLAILLIAGYAASRRSLTAWIFVGLLAGAELGHDAPGVYPDTFGRGVPVSSTGKGGIIGSQSFLSPM